MKKFRFQLQTVLDLRKRAEDEALRAVALAQKARQVEIERREACLAQLSTSYRNLEALNANPAAGTAYQAEQTFIDGTKHRIAMAEQAILRASRGVEKAMHAFLLARRKTRAIEVLRERAFAEYKHEVSRAEFKELDDLNVMRSRFRE